MARKAGIGAHTRYGTQGIRPIRVVLRLEALEDRCLLSAGISLTPSEPAPQLVGEPITWTATDPAATAGGNLTLTASDVSNVNPGATITQVAFYVQANGTTTLLGYGTQNGSGAWTLTVTVSLAPGGYTLLAQAEDSFGFLGDPLAIALTVQS